MYEWSSVTTYYPKEQRDKNFENQLVQEISLFDKKINELEKKRDRLRIALEVYKEKTGDKK